MSKPTLKQLELICHQTHNSIELQLLEDTLYKKQGVILLDAGSKSNVLINLFMELKESQQDDKIYNLINKRINQVLLSKSDNFVVFHSLSKKNESGLHVVRPYLQFIYYDCKKIITNPIW